MINVSKPYLPDMDEYVRYLSGIWERCWLTNNGPLVNDLELKLKEYLGVNHMLLMGNGTIALQVAIKALDLHGEIITTPFSYIATTSSILWEGCQPVYVDIDKNTLNIDPAKIEAAITDKTTAILATHVFGNPCDIEAIDAIAKKHDLKVIYDAAHCFGSKYKGKSAFAYGHISTTSFHATKLFHTVEGGAVFTQDADLLKKMAYQRNFGHETPETYACVGINARNTEFHAAMGLVNLKSIDAILQSRKTQSQAYDIALRELRVKKQKLQADSEWNFSYYPVIFESEEQLLKAVAELNGNWVYPRRYFYPSLSALPFVNKYDTPVSDDISKRV
ncbi:MAG: DegT/DnrJ/EryC1/StrS family aminotransferase, partial [Flavipsychrobacter sp.]|nr:DegT/DnrJ/EryC1/StrS family aminotransferase [Flavipsychrobacter sp.]